MQAYVIEELRADEWRRGSRIFWRRADAERHGQIRLQLQSVRAVRLVPVQLNLAASFELERTVRA